MEGFSCWKHNRLDLLTVERNKLYFLSYHNGLGGNWIIVICIVIWISVVGDVPDDQMIIVRTHIRIFEKSSVWCAELSQSIV